MHADIVRRRLEKFWGYGDPKARTWFIGIEEGGGDDLEQRFLITDGKSFVDVAEEMGALERHMQFYRQKEPKIQNTLRWPILLYLNLWEGLPIENSEEARKTIRSAQSFRIGRIHNPEVALLEFSPLPSKSLAVWKHSEYGIEDLESRKTFASYLDRRTEQLFALYQEHKPNMIIFYGIGKNFERIKRLADRTLECIRVDDSRYYIGENGHTTFLVLPQGHGNISTAKLAQFAGIARERIGITTAPHT